MTTPDLEALFAQSLANPASLNWFADQLLAAAAQVDHLMLEANGRTLAGSVDGVVVNLDAFHRLARPLFARIAKVATKEAGQDFNPYGCRGVLHRVRDSGLVELSLELSNTPDSQVLHITSRPVRGALAGAAGLLDRDEVVQKL